LLPVTAAQEETSTKNEMELDEALGRLGNWGRWQILYFLMLSMACMFPASWHMFAIVFIGKTFTRARQIVRYCLYTYDVHVIASYSVYASCFFPP